MPLKVELTDHEVWLIKNWHAVASNENGARWDEETQALFRKLGIVREPEL